MRLGRGVLDARLTVWDTNGLVLADVDDSWLAVQDPVISLVAPADGRYLVQVREAAYGGSGDAHYRLHIGAFPRPSAVYPPGGRRGQPSRWRFSVPRRVR